MIKGEKMTVLEENIKVLDPEKNNSNSQAVNKQTKLK